MWRMILAWTLSCAVAFASGVAIGSGAGSKRHGEPHTIDHARTEGTQRPASADESEWIVAPSDPPCDSRLRHNSATGVVILERDYGLPLTVIEPETPINTGVGCTTFHLEIAGRRIRNGDYWCITVRGNRETGVLLVVRVSGSNVVLAEIDLGCGHSADQWRLMPDGRSVLVCEHPTFAAYSRVHAFELRQRWTPISRPWRRMMEDSDSGVGTWKLEAGDAGNGATYDPCVTITYQSEFDAEVLVDWAADNSLCRLPEPSPLPAKPASRLYYRSGHWFDIGTPLAACDADLGFATSVECRSRLWSNYETGVVVLFLDGQPPLTLIDPQDEIEHSGANVFNLGAAVGHRCDGVDYWAIPITGNCGSGELALFRVSNAVVETSKIPLGWTEFRLTPDCRSVFQWESAYMVCEVRAFDIHDSWQPFVRPVDGNTGLGEPRIQLMIDPSRDG